MPDAKVQAYPRFTRGVFVLHEKWQCLWPFRTGRSSFRHIIDILAAAGMVPPAWVRLPIGFEMWLDISDFIQHEILVHRIWSPEITAFLQKHLKPGDHFVDIGANVGYFSLLAATLVGRSGHVTSFEPNPEVFRLLKANIERNGFLVSAHQEACSDAEAKMPLYINATGNSGEGSLSQANARGARAYDVCCVVPDIVLRDRPRPKLIKIDVEGAEMMVLRGLRNTLASQPLLCLEVDDRRLKPMGTSAEEVCDYLTKECGYKITRVGVDVFAE